MDTILIKIIKYNILLDFEYLKKFMKGQVNGCYFRIVCPLSLIIYLKDCEHIKILSKLTAI
jgi:hypothetical protein